MQYPIVVELDGRSVVVVGGGRVAERKVTRLLEAGATVLINSPRLTTRLAELAANGEVQWLRGEYEAEVVAGAALVFAATDDPALNDQVLRDARAAGVWANSASGREVGFIVPAVGVVEQVGVAVWSGSPAFSVRLRDELVALIDDRWQRAARVFARLRGALDHDVLPDQTRRAQLWRRLAAAIPARFGTDDEAHKLVREVLADEDLPAEDAADR